MKEQHFATTHASIYGKGTEKKEKKKIMQVTKSELKESIYNVHVYSYSIAQVY